MLEVRFVRDSRKRLSSVFANGHTELAEHGEDIACAAVSALLQAVWVGLTDVAKIRVEGRHDYGDYALLIPESERDRVDVQAIVATAEISVAEIARQYGRAIHCDSSEEA